MNINYIILGHKNPKQIKRMVSRLDDNMCFFYVHIDKKSDINSFKKELMSFNNVFILKDRVNVIWGGFSQIEATLIALKEIKSHERKGYSTLLSGQDYPIKSNKFIQSFYKKHDGMNFISLRPIEKVWSHYRHRIFNYSYKLYPHKRGNTLLHAVYSSDFYSRKNVKNILLIIYKLKNLSVLQKIFIKRTHPDHITPFGGSSWWSLPMNTVLLILEYIEKNESFMKYHRFTHCSDEILFHSIVSHIIKPENIKKSVTHVNWSRKNTVLPVTFKTTMDFIEIEESVCLFARKFNENSMILDKIDSELLDS